MNSLTPTVIIIAVLLFLRFFCFGSTSDAKIKKDMEKQKKKAMHPPADKSLRRKSPNQGDFLLGKQGNKYICWDTSKDAHILVIGGSGSGKSSCLVLPFLLTNPDATIFAIDIKGELVAKSREKDDDRICVFSPHDHSGYGFDVFYNLDDDSTPQDILATMQTIAFSLIPLGNSSDQYWSISARNLLTGLSIYYWDAGRHDLIAIIDAILGSPIRDQIDEMANTADPKGNAYKYLNQFNGMACETLLSVYSNMANSLSCFSDINLRWAFSEAPRKCSPLTLEEGRSIFLSIPEHKLAPYSGALAMVINLTLDNLSKRPEDSRNRIFFILDEFGRISGSGGCLDSLIDYCQTLRSRRVTLFLVVQQVSSLKINMKEAQVITLVGNCNIRIILNASESETQKMVCNEWVPKYIQRKQTKTTHSNSNNNSFSFEEKNRVDPADLMELTKRDEAVVITPMGFSILSKCPYYKDKYLAPIAEQIKKHNERRC